MREQGKADCSRYSGTLYTGKIINKTVIIVDNLKPAKLMGMESQGMLLAAKIDGKLKVVTTEGEFEDGADVS